MKWNRCFPVIALSILAMFYVPNLARAFTSFPPAKVFVYPDELEVKCGQSFQVYINVSGVTKLEAFDFMLKYSSSVLRCVSLEEGSFLSSGGTTFVAKNEINNEYSVGVGRVWLAVALLDTANVNGSGVLGVVTFNATAGGESVLDLYSDFPYSPDLVKLSACVSTCIRHVAVDGHVVVVCPSPPVECKVTFLTCPVCSNFNITFAGATYYNGSVGTFAYGTSGSATANCGVGYVFDHWEVSGNVEVSSTTANPTCFTITCGGILKAVCRAAAECKVTFLTCPVCSNFNITFAGATYYNGSVGTFAYGTSGSATANCGVGYVFDHWEVSGNVQVSWVGMWDNPARVTITCGGTLKAVCKMCVPANDCPVASFTFKTYGTRVDFDASASFDSVPGRAIVSYRWDFGDGNTTAVSDSAIMHDYATAGTYKVTLTVVNDLDESNSTERIVTVYYTADLNSDAKVDILDIFPVAMAFGSKSGDPNWNARADLDKNGIIDILDVFVAAWDYGKAV
jgi:hypothetical protein